jgi:hypothetical protein
LFREPHNWKCSVHQLQAEAVQPVRKWAAWFHSSTIICCPIAH